MVYNSQSGQSFLSQLSPNVITLRFRINGALGGGALIFFLIFADPLQHILPPPFANFSNFTREVNKVFKDHPKFVSSLLYFVLVF